MARTSVPSILPESARVYNPSAVRDANKAAEKFRAELELKKNPPKKKSKRGRKNG